MKGSSLAVLAGAATISAALHLVPLAAWREGGGSGRDPSDGSAGPPVRVRFAAPTPCSVPPDFSEEAPRPLVTDPPAPSLEAPVAGPPAPPIRLPTPVYPRSCVRLGHEGRVAVEVSVGAGGRALSAVVTRSSGCPAMDRAALSTAMAGDYPGRSGGRVGVEVGFRLEE